MIKKQKRDSKQGRLKGNRSAALIKKKVVDPSREFVTTATSQDIGQGSA
jgi:hypothetical protein